MLKKIFDSCFIYFTILSVLCLISRPFTIYLRGLHINTYHVFILNVFLSLLLVIFFRNYILLFLITLGSYFYFYYGYFIYRLFAFELFLTNFISCSIINWSLIYNTSYVHKYHFYFLIFFSTGIFFFSINGLAQRYVFNHCVPKNPNGLMTVSEVWDKFYDFGLLYVSAHLQKYYFLLVKNNYLVFKRVMLKLLRKKRQLVINRKDFHLPNVMKLKLTGETLGSSSMFRTLYVISFTYQIIWILELFYF